MSNNMLGKLLLSDVQGPRDEFESRLAGEDGAVWFAEFKRFLRKESCWGNGEAAQASAPKAQTNLLFLVGTTQVSATTSPFAAKTKFVLGTKRNAKVLISYLSDNFTAWFLSGKGKIEDPISEQTLRYHKLLKASVDGPIIAELGGEEKSETTLSEMYSRMEVQGSGEAGCLLTNGYANIFYVKDQIGVLRAVRVDWSGDGWHVYAFPVEHSSRWFDGRHVFSRNVLEPCVA